MDAHTIKKRQYFMGCLMETSGNYLYIRCPILNPFYSG